MHCGYSHPPVVVNGIGLLDTPRVPQGSVAYKNKFVLVHH